MKIAFTGHRDATTNERELTRVMTDYPGATWVHGGAKGFDNQVSLFAKSHNIPQVVVRPDYGRYPSKVAPLIRNKDIVNQSLILVACYDGRQKGGTFQTINYARKLGKQVSLVAVQNSKP